VNDLSHLLHLCTFKTQPLKIRLFKNQPLKKAEAKELKENWPLANFVSAEPKYLKEKRMRRFCFR